MKQLPQRFLPPMRMDIVSAPHSFHPVQPPHEVDSVMAEKQPQRRSSDLLKVTQLESFSCSKLLGSIFPQNLYKED